MKKQDLIKAYQYSDWPERIPFSWKNKLRKIIGKQEVKNAQVIRKDRWVGVKSDKYAAKVVRPGRRIVESEQMTIKKPFGYWSHKRDLFLAELSKKAYYTFENILVIVDPYYWAPLTAMAVFSTEVQCRVRYTVKGKTKQSDYCAETVKAKNHSVPILGLYADYKNTVLLELLDDDGKVIQKRNIYVQTKPLPEDLKEIVECKQHKKKSAFSNILITGGLYLRTFAFDEEGEIRYYLHRKTKAYGIFPIPGGRYLFMEKYVDVPSFSVSQACFMHEVDYMGRVYHSYFCKKGFHHCACEKEPGGNLLLGSNSFLDGCDENTIIELDRESGEIVDEVNLSELFDQKYQTSTDWIHVNSVQYCDYDNSIVVSMRNIHSVAKIDWKTKKLRWILANPKFWENTKVEDKVLKPVGEITWIYQQHAAVPLTDSMEGPLELLVYDNHWARRRPVEFYDGDEAHSYLSIFSIDEEKLTVSLKDSVTCENSRIRSNAILDSEHDRIFNMAGDLIPKIEESAGMIEEYEYSSKTLLNRYYIKPGFFTAYEFKPDIKALCNFMPDDYRYFRGNTLTFEPIAKSQLPDVTKAEKMRYRVMKVEEVEEEDGEETKKLTKDVVCYFQEDVLFVRAKDHSITQIYLVGQNNCYMVDLTATYQTMDLFKETVFRIPFWLNNIASGKYRIYFHYLNTLYDSEDTFTIHK